MVGPVPSASWRRPGRCPIDFHRGQRIGKYELLTQLSVGGMAEIFLAFTAGPGGFRKYVVLKRILPDVQADESFVSMFMDEARITAALNHPNIAQVFELGQDEDGLYLAMEFIPGQNLNQVASECHALGRRVPVGLTLSVVRDVCLALHYAHTFRNAAGWPSPVVHRDVAQKNIMVTYDGAVKLLDFGIAKVRGGTGRTQVGMVKGTTGYMSPEQVAGEPLDGRSDVFALGVVMHEMLTGERLFAGEDPQDEMMKILEAPIPPPHTRLHGLSRDVSAVVMKALERNRGDRFQNALEMARTLERAVGPGLYDLEQRAAFMRELFARRRVATEQLLGSAERDAPVSTRLVREVRGADEGFLELQAGPKPSVAPVKEQASEEVEAPEPASRGRQVVEALVVAGVSLLVVGLALVGWKVLSSVDAQAVLPEEPVGEVSPVQPLQGQAAGSLAPPPTLNEGEGLLSLLLVPPADVYREGDVQPVGRTPLQLAMPAGERKLRIRDERGVWRTLPVSITAGRTTSIRLRVAELAFDKLVANDAGIPLPK